MFGLFGAHSCSLDALETVAKRLSLRRQRHVVRLTNNRIPLADARSLDAARIEDRWRVLISGPYLAREKSHTDVGTSENCPTVAFVGHLSDLMARTDVLAHNPADIVQTAYAKWGRDCFERLDGNFSLAIFDPALPGWLLVRDAAGSKPIFFSFSDNFVFGSSAIEVLQAAGKAAVANPAALRRYLIHGTPVWRQETLLEGVLAVPGGHYLELTLGCLPRIRPILNEDSAKSHNAPMSFVQATGELRCILMASVKTQSFGRKVGVALSGGIDSSGVVGCLRASVDPAAQVNAFSFVHRHPALPDVWNELQWARLAANHAGATLHTVGLEASAIPGIMSRVVRNQEFPFSSPVVLAHAEVLRIAAETGMEVMLSGHGPDTLFGGGSSHIAARAASLLRCGRIFAAWALLQKASEYAALSPERLLLSSVRQALPALGQWRRLLASAPWARDSWFSDRCAAENQESVFESTDLMRRVILDQLYRSTLPTSLHIEDRNATALGLENRFPYLVAAMLRFADRLPAEYLVSDSGATKHVIRGALRGLVPDVILDRRNRVGFPVPALPWLHELRPWVEDRLRDMSSLPFFQETSVSSIWDRLRGMDSSAWTTAYRAWRWISLLEWMKAHDVKCH